MFCIFWYESSKEKIAILTFSVVYTCTKREQLCNWKYNNYEISLADYGKYIHSRASVVDLNKSIQILKSIQIRFPKFELSWIESIHKNGITELSWIENGWK